nr:unnamed protein product [Spirometra erinaceieuropaei]
MPSYLASSPSTDRSFEVEREKEEEKISGHKEELPSNSHTSDSEAKDGELPVTEEMGNMSNQTVPHESPDQPNSSKVMKGSFISLGGFFLLWLSLMVIL